MIERLWDCVRQKLPSTAHAFNPSTIEAEADRYPGVQGHHGLQVTDSVSRRNRGRHWLLTFLIALLESYTPHYF